MELVAIRRAMNTNETMLLSVVIPTVGRPELQTIVDFALALARGPVQVEVIVVDDRKQGEGNLVRPDGRVRIVQGPRKGCAGPARNAGIAEARGEWIQFCDDDDYLHPHLGLWLQELLTRAPRTELVVWRAAGHFDHLPPDFVIPPRDCTSPRLGLVTMSYCVRKCGSRTRFFHNDPEFDIDPHNSKSTYRSADDFEYLQSAILDLVPVAFAHKHAYGYRTLPPPHSADFPLVLLN